MATPKVSSRMAVGVKPADGVTFPLAGQADLRHIVALDHGASISGNRKMMRSLLFCLACLPALSMAQKLPDNFSQEIFERRFRAADKDGDGRLNRSEAYAEFPRAPRFFDEIDGNGDNHVTLIEFNQAMDRRAATVLEAGSLGTAAKYVKPEYLKGGHTQAAGETGARDMASSIAQRRSHEFDELLGSAQDHEPYPDLPVVNSASNLVKKSY